MEPQNVERRLTTILTADIVGYSLLTGLDALRGRIGSSVRQRNDP